MAFCRLRSAVDGRPHRLRAIVSDQTASLGSLEQPIANLLLVELAAGDDLKQIEGGGVEDVVARTRLRLGDDFAFPLERRARPGLVALPRPVFRSGQLDQPARCWNGLARAGGVPLVERPVGAPTRGEAHIAALAAHIDALANFAGAVADFDPVVPSKDEMPSAARGDGHQRWRQLAVLADQLRQRRGAVDVANRITVDIDHPHVACRPGRRGDHCVGPPLPPVSNLVFVGGCVLETAVDQRLLVERVGGEYGNPLLCINKRGFKFVGCPGLGLRGHVIFPPSLKKRLCKYLC